MPIIIENKNDLSSIKVKSFLRQDKNFTNIDFEFKNNCIKTLRTISNCSNSHNHTTNMHKLKNSKLRYNQTIVLGLSYINIIRRVLAAHNAAEMASCHGYFSSTLQAFKKYFTEFALGSSVSYFNV
jgi:hypothetical protein